MDSDCNPSSAGGVLFTTVGYSKLPAQFNTGLNEERIFDHTAYNFPRLLAVCEKLTRQILAKYGGRVETDANGEEVFVIPVTTPKPSKLELSWAPGPIANSMFTPEEMAQIKFDATPQGMIRAVERFAPGWKIQNCGTEMNPGFRAEWQGKKNVLATHPLDQNTACVLTKTVAIPSGKPVLHIVVGHDPQGDFDLVVRADGKELLRKPVTAKTATDHWLTQDIDLSAYAGKTVKLELVNQPSGWSYEAAYWAEIRVQ
jgi:hypothetical protein